MCCLPSKQAKIITVLFSTLSVLGGLLVIGLCFNIVLNTDMIYAGKRQDITENQSGDGNDGLAGLGSQAGKVIACVYFTASGVILFGLLGICTAKIQTSLCICLHGLLSFALAAFVLSIAFALLSFVVVGEAEQASFCEGEIDDNSTYAWALEEARGYIAQVDGHLQANIDTHMCSTASCPCVAVDFDLWDETTRLELEKTAQQGGLYTFRDESTNGYETFEDCY